MRKGAAFLLGEHDFSAFRAAECQSITPVKTMNHIGIERQGDLIVFTFEANAFLHHMIRNIIGSLIEVGKNNQPPEWIGKLLDGRDTVSYTHLDVYKRQGFRGLATGRPQALEGFSQSAGGRS